MPYRIVTPQCTACGACEIECPSSAIGFTGAAYSIDAALCTECAGRFETPQCASVCPVPQTCVPA
ncbi:4Fe-4S binding protein [Cereibacter azotoformans]|uniref:4Fe-4S binding protein n=1 Tax=Cereibacter TaxID=1653176 RepID=UPI000C6EB792|nr:MULTISPECIES: 4Fe-4S binding protein [Cereibacter]